MLDRPFKIASVLIAILFLAEPACASKALGLDEIQVLDSGGLQITQSEPARDVTFRAAGTFDRPGIVILFGAVSGANWSEKLSPRFRLGFAGDYSAEWKSSVPFNVRGEARVDITGYSPVFKGLIIRTAFLTILPFSAAYVGSQSCSACHNQVYQAWQGSRHYPYTGCESCHGPGGNHVTAPSAATIVVDRSSGVCMPCHSRNNGQTIEAENGFIKPQQQYNEWAATAHGKILQCAGCHEPHYSLGAPQAIKAGCASCHPEKRVYLGMQHLNCESCHMAPAVNTGGASGIGPYRSGDAPSHIWRIKTQSPPEAMYAGDQVNKDLFGPFLTLDIACMSCHNGLNARLYDFESMRQTATLVH